MAEKDPVYFQVKMAKDQERKELDDKIQGHEHESRELEREIETISAQLGSLEEEQTKRKLMQQTNDKILSILLSSKTKRLDQ